MEVKDLMEEAQNALNQNKFMVNVKSKRIQEHNITGKKNTSYA